MHLLLPFLVALAHRHGYIQWFKREWVTLEFWLALFRLVPLFLSSPAAACMRTALLPRWRASDQGWPLSRWPLS